MVLSYVLNSLFSFSAAKNFTNLVCFLLIKNRAVAALSDVHSLTISTGQWSTIVSSSWIQRAYFRAAVDDRNMIYYFGGGTLSSTFIFQFIKMDATFAVL